MRPALRRRLPVIRRMRFLRYAATQYDRPEYGIGWHRIGQRAIGIHAARGMRRYYFIWRTLK